MEQIIAAQLRLGVPPRPKTILPASSPPLINPWSLKTFPVVTPPAPDLNLSTNFPELSSTTTTRNSTPLTQPINQPDKKVTSAVAAIMAHMSHIWALMTKVDQMIKLLPQELKNEAAVALKSAQQKSPDGNLLQTVLDQARDSTPSSIPPQGPYQENTKKTRMPTNRRLELNSEPTPHLKTKIDPKQITSIDDRLHDNLALRPGTSEGSTPGKVYS
jgi:hypothetical protein